LPYFDQFIMANTSAAAARESDALIARKLQAVEQLVGIFGFEYEVAEQAVDFVAREDAPMIDVTECYNYILDAGLAQDQGGPVTPIDSCPHVSTHCCITVGQLPMQPASATCTYVTAAANARSGRLKSETANDDGVTCAAAENWLCLECGVVRCSRYCNGHALAHWEETKEQQQQDDNTSSSSGHCVAVSLSDLSVWCHVCNAYLSTSTGPTGQTLQPLIKQLENLKFMMGSYTLVLQEPKTKKYKHDSRGAHTVNESSGE
jgi:Zn-finger in ubiquitin-hydrolases and other protein